MITLNSEKTPEQTIELLKEQTLAIKISNFFRSTFLWKLQGNVLAGKIKNNEFCLILVDKHMVNLPLRFFIGKVISADNKTIIEGKFRWHPFWLYYDLALAICILAIFARGFLVSIPLSMAFFIVCLVPSIIVLRLKISIGKDNEEATIERIKEIIAK